jgi:hypothetical protein
MTILRRAKEAILRSEYASLDVDLRYMPVVRFLAQFGPEATVLEVGSGYVGIVPYINRTVIGVDAEFPDDPIPQLIPVVSKGPLPFRDKTFDLVISLDTLEHLPREHRQAFCTELIRTATGGVIIGFPEGTAAAKQDATLEAYYVKEHGTTHPYFVEHRNYGVPKGEEVSAYFLRAREELHREFRVHRTKNVNIRLRGLFMRLIWHHSRFAHRVYFLLTALSRWDWLFHVGQCYRSIYFLSLDQTDHSRETWQGA